MIRAWAGWAFRQMPNKAAGCMDRLEILGMDRAQNVNILARINVKGRL